ncbi:MAG TPA: hypothetical protein VGV38_00550, partial [Pyrinomonadaceae bacterium]|nr:hypothetical protein [Pyrinomonadaceae bacterium]
QAAPQTSDAPPHDAATTNASHTPQRDAGKTHEARAPQLDLDGSRAAHPSRKASARLPRVAAAAAAVVLLLAGGALFYRYARRAPSTQAARPVEVVQPPTNVQELQPAPSPQAEQVVEAGQQPDGQILDANGQVITDPNAAQGFPGGVLTPFPSTAITTAPTDMTVVPAQRGAVVPPIPRNAAAARDEPAVVEYADPDDAPAEPRREPARPERREDRTRPQAPPDASPRRDATAAQTQPQRAAEDESLPSSMIAPKPAATPKKKVIQWP